MEISKYNSEGYSDPTTHDALANITKKEEAVRKAAFKPLVYICSPYAGDTRKNTKKARRYCRFAVEQNAIPIAMHLLLPQFMDDNNPAERELAMFMNIVLLGKCNELWVFGNIISNGMEQEISKAKKRRQTIRYFNEEMEEVSE